ncbi:MAG: hypothetical protein AAF550_02805 [Myxococcota bacterium]
MRKSEGFLAILFQIARTDVFDGAISCDAHRSRFKKDQCRFLPRSNLALLRERGLSRRDKDVLKGIGFDLAGRFDTFVDDRCSELGITRPRMGNACYLFDTALKENSSSWNGITEEFLGRYTQCAQMERSVSRKDGVHLLRPVFEYRLFNAPGTLRLVRARLSLRSGLCHAVLDRYACVPR